MLESKGQLIIKDKARRSLNGHHPWVFSGAVKAVSDDIFAGDVVDIIDGRGAYFGKGFFNPESQIVARVITFEERECSLDMIRERVERAISLRRSFREYDQSTAWRLVYAEADHLPGLIVDYYSGYVNVQFHSAGWEPVRSEILSMISELTGCISIFDGSDPEMRAKEGLHTVNEAIFGDEPPDNISVIEFGRKYDVDIKKGQKSGLYLDQKFNHQSIQRFATGRRVLDCFAYTGGFTLAALDGGCDSVTAIEISETAVAQIDINVSLNRRGSAEVKVLTGDAFDLLRVMADKDEQFDMIILDPPAFCKAKTAIIPACRGYKDINRIAMQLLSPNGILVSCSCSRPISDELFMKVLWQASVEAGREAQLLSFTGQSPDHPVLLTFPESKYLKCATLLAE
jgi:23S rRNA (cytosine1962-C5)-methyltransferase